MKRTFFLVILLVILKHITFAVPAIPTPFVVQQADGTQVTIRLHGDEFFSYATTEDGFLAIQNSENQWVFADVDKNDNIVPTTELARAKQYLSESVLKYFENINQNIDIQSIGIRRQENRIASMQNTQQSQQRASVFTGEMKGIVILVNFTDKQFVVQNPQQSFTNLLNQQGYNGNGGTGSARDYFIDNSMGAFSPQFDVYGPYNLSQNMVYYGGNNTSGYDMRPGEMVKEACNLAYAAGVDFTQYDYNHDGIVDQVFIYYAGNNEAEGGGANTIWPHRSAVWSSVGSAADKMYIQDYACSSELRSASPSALAMCGVGTFIHEFGHILTLPDLYNTANQSAVTLGSWDVMDSGPYLNLGRTPPRYSSYERFYIGWLTPRIINNPENVVLNPLHVSNDGLMVTETGQSNLIGTYPTPTLFYLLENRQKTGWDAYLPFHGLLITKVKFNQSRWNSNTVNNYANDLGVDLIKANGGTTYGSGVPFPGAALITSYNIVINSTTKPLTEISESGGIINFKFMGGVTAAPNIHIEKPKIFIENNNLVIETQNYEIQQISIFNIEGKEMYNTNFTNSIRINKNDFPNGIYFVRVGNFIGKVIF